MKHRNKCHNVRKGLKLCEQKLKQEKKKSDDYKWNERPWNGKSLNPLNRLLQLLLNQYRLPFKRRLSLAPHHGSRAALPPCRKLKQTLSYEKTMLLLNLQLLRRILQTLSSVWQQSNRQRHRPRQQNQRQLPLVHGLIPMIGILSHPIRRRVVMTNRHQQGNVPSI